MLLSRIQPLAQNATQNLKKEELRLFGQMQDMLNKRDYTGAMTILSIASELPPLTNTEQKLWTAYCAYHLADYKQAAEIYKTLLTPNDDVHRDVYTYLACCYFMSGMYEETMRTVKRGPSSSLRNRLEMHTAHNMKDFSIRSQRISKLSQTSVEDQLSLAAIKVADAEYNDALNIYRQLLIQDKSNVSLYVYIAFCWYKSSYYERSQEMLSFYLERYPDSILATNLRACIMFYEMNGRVAEMELKKLQDKMTPCATSACNDLLRHNRVVFRNGIDGAHVLTSLVDVIPEARVNLVICHLKQGNVTDAAKWFADIQPSNSVCVALKAVIHLLKSHETNSCSDKRLAGDLFEQIGTSVDNADTVLGRQCLASYYFLMAAYREAIDALDSIKVLQSGTDEFNFNYGQAKVAVGDYQAALAALRMVQDHRYRCDYCYLSCLIRCYVMTGKSRLAWDMYANILKSDIDPVNIIPLLSQIANECFKTGQFYYAAKAFNALQQLYPASEFLSGMIASCIGTFQNIIAKKERKRILPEILLMLQATNVEDVKEVQVINKAIRAMRDWVMMF